MFQSLLSQKHKLSKLITNTNTILEGAPSLLCVLGQGQGQGPGCERLGQGWGEVETRSSGSC